MTAAPASWKVGRKTTTQGKVKKGEMRLQQLSRKHLEEGRYYQKKMKQLAALGKIRFIRMRSIRVGIGCIGRDLTNV